LQSNEFREIISNAKFHHQFFSQRTNYLFKLAQEQEHEQNAVYLKAKAIPLVATIPCTAGDATLAATSNESHNGIWN
jgi:hypothetical protein